MFELVGLLGGGQRYDYKSGQAKAQGFQVADPHKVVISIDEPKYMKWDRWTRILDGSGLGVDGGEYLAKAFENPIGKYKKIKPIIWSS